MPNRNQAIEEAARRLRDEVWLVEKNKLKYGESQCYDLLQALDKAFDLPDPRYTNPEYDEILAGVKRIEAHTPMEDERGCLFTVTTIAKTDAYGGTRCPGICMTFDRAREIVEKNEGDIWEHSYMLCVIEAVIPDCLYGSNGDHQWWYVWDLEQEKYLPIETPEVYKNRFGYGVG